MKLNPYRILGYLTFFTLSSLCAEPNEGLESKGELYEGKQYKNAFANPEDHPDRPNVLLIGDSISIGYTVELRKLIGDKADIFRIPGNGKFSGHGLNQLDKWVKGRKWDVIHFNWGLWDICYRNPKSKNQGHRDKVNGKLTTSPEQYQENMTKLVVKLKKTGAKLIWCHTTPVPEGEHGRIVGDAVKYNGIADKIMKRNGVAINELHAHALLKMPQISKNKGDVHFTAAGYKYLAEKVASEITQSLGQEK